MCCGDSITYSNGGTGGYGAWKQHFVNRLYTLYGWLARASEDIVGSTWNGYCSYPMCGTAGIRADALNSTYLPPDLAAYSPELLIIHIGTNDVLSGASTSTIMSRITNCLDTIRAAVPTAKVWICKIIDRSGYTTEVNDLNNTIGTTVPARSDAAYITVFDMNTVLGPYNVTYYNDVTHPNNVGYKIMGDALADYFYTQYPEAV